MATAGDFSASQIVTAVGRAQDLWGKGMYENQYIPETNAAKIVLANQSAVIKVLDDPDRDIPGAKVYWADACGVVDEACTETCELDKPELSTNAKTYNITLCRQSGFSLDREKQRTDLTSREEKMALGFAAMGKKLDEYIAVTTLTKLKSFAGYNFSPAPGTWDNANSTTVVPAASYNHTLAAYLIQAGILNKMEDNYKISNGELFIDYQNSLFEQGNLDGKGRAEMMKALNLNWDLVNFAKAGLSEDMFMVARNAVAIKSYNMFSATPEVVGSKVGDTLFSIPSPSLPGVRYDVTYQVVCKTTGGKKRYLDEFDARARFDVWQNPAACPQTVTIGGTPTVINPGGVLSYTKGS